MYYFFPILVHICRTHGHRSRLVHAKNPAVGYNSTDSLSVSGVATDGNDASDEDSSDEGVSINIGSAMQVYAD